MTEAIYGIWVRSFECVFEDTNETFEFGQYMYARTYRGDVSVCILNNYAMHT